jgi:prolyl-tRNA synthetase
MTLVPTGEDTLITCSSCAYKANREIATSPFRLRKEAERPCVKFPTPGAKTIADLAKFCAKPDVLSTLGASDFSASDTAKAVMFQNKQEELVVAFLRGDLDVEEQKLKVALQMEIFPAKEETIARAKAIAGSTGPVGLDISRSHIVVDASVVGSSNLVVGANETDVHMGNFNAERDFLSGLSDWEKKRVTVVDVASARAGDPCPTCGEALKETRGIEIGNIFHLGTRYSGTMNMTYLDTAGKAQTPVMGCYGIGITRLLAALIEEHHDDRGPLIPLPVAPFQIHVCVLNGKEAGVMEKAKALYDSLGRKGIEVLLDDRDEKPGSQFADADLFGIPLRVIVSPKTLAEASFEFKFRDNREPAKLVKFDGAVAFLEQTLASEMARYNVD